MAAGLLRAPHACHPMILCATQCKHSTPYHHSRSGWDQFPPTPHPPHPFLDHASPHLAPVTAALNAVPTSPTNSPALALRTSLLCLVAPKAVAKKSSAPRLYATPESPKMPLQRTRERVRGGGGVGGQPEGRRCGPGASSAADVASRGNKGRLNDVFGRCFPLGGSRRTNVPVWCPGMRGVRLAVLTDSCRGRPEVAARSRRDQTWPPRRRSCRTASHNIPGCRVRLRCTP